MENISSGKIIMVSAWFLLAGIFLFVHYTQVDGFGAKVDGIDVTGVSSKGTPLVPSSIRKIRLKTEWVEINLQKGKNRVVLTTADNIRHTLVVTGWLSGENWVRVNLNNDVSFTVKTDTIQEEILIEPMIPDTQPPVISLEIPIRIVRKARVSSVPRRPDILLIEAGQDKCTAILPRGARWNIDTDRLNLAVTKENSPVFRVISGNWNGIPVKQWLDKAKNDGTILSQAEYNKKIRTWRVAVRSGWKSRYDTRSKLWITSKGTPVWSDTLVTTYLSDSLFTGTYQANKQIVLTGMRQEPTSVGWLVSPFMGNIVNQGRAHAQDIDRIAVGLANDTIENISTGLVYLQDTGRSEVAKQIVANAFDYSENSITWQEAVNSIMLLNEAKELGLANSKTVDTTASSLIDNVFLPNIYWKNNGLWLMDEYGIVDVSNSIKVGGMLQNLGQTTNQGDYISIGQQMVATSLALVHENGLMPSHVSFLTDGETVSEGNADPELFYRFIIDLPAWPRHVSLYRQLGAGSWALTGAEYLNVQKIERGTLITINFQPGETHYMALKGNIEPFNVIQMLGRTWNPDINFQNYFTGWYFDEATHIVFIKIRHRNRREVLRLMYVEPVAEEPEPEEVEGNEEAEDINVDINTDITTDINTETNSEQTENNQADTTDQAPQ